MKYIRVYFLVLLVYTIIPLYASIDSDIEAIQNASEKEKFKLMNAFKKNLVQMKEEERIQAMTKLTKDSKNVHAKKALDELKEKSKLNRMKKYIEQQQIHEDNIASETEDMNGGDNDED